VRAPQAHRGARGRRGASLRTLAGPWAHWGHMGGGLEGGLCVLSPSHAHQGLRGRELRNAHPPRTMGTWGAWEGAKRGPHLFYPRRMRGRRKDRSYRPRSTHMGSVGGARWGGSLTLRSPWAHGGGWGGTTYIIQGARKEEHAGTSRAAGNPCAAHKNQEGLRDRRRDHTCPPHTTHIGEHGEAKEHCAHSARPTSRHVPASIEGGKATATHTIARTHTGEHWEL
jgi:hypothetical protein